MSEALRVVMSNDHPNTEIQVEPATASIQAPRAEPYLQVHELTKKYGEFTALKNVSLLVNEGEFVCFLGPSGCGKTTLLRAIAGLEFQTSGSLTQGGVDVSWLPPNKRDFGIVFQSYALFPNLTVAQNIAFGLENAQVGKAEIDTIVTDLLANIGLPDSGNKYPGQLSGGQQQRVALARALATSPSLLLLDEPLSALDAQVRVHLRREIKRLQHQLGVTTIMVTHDQEEAMSMADRIVVMNHGRIEQVGTPEEIYQNPASTFVAQFVGTINLLPCTVTGPSSVDIHGQTFSVPRTDHLSGPQGLLAIRPEDIQLDDGSMQTENSLDTCIDDMEFLGSFVRLKLSQAGGEMLTADLSMHVLRRLSPAVGDKLRLRFNPEFIHLFDADAAVQ